MIISHKPKFIFVHIPRTGGTSTREVLKNYGGVRYISHEKLSDLKRVKLDHQKEKAAGIENLNLEDTKDYFKWTRVRNPWDRLVSIYGRRKKDFEFSERFPERPTFVEDATLTQARDSFNSWI